LHRGVPGLQGVRDRGRRVGQDLDPIDSGGMPRARAMDVRVMISA